MRQRRTVLEVAPLEARLVPAAPEVFAINPSAFTHTAPTDTDILAVFDQSLNAISVSDLTLVVHGGQSGQLLSAGGDAWSVATTSIFNDSVVVNPGGDFFPGELVQVTVTAGVRNTLGEGAEPRVWQFTTAVDGGSGVFSDSGQTLGAYNTQSMALGDVDGDGDLDIVEGNKQEANRVWLNNGSGVFSDSGQTLGSQRTDSVTLGDVDGDGDLDLVTGNSGQGNRVWLNDGSGVFTDSGQSLGNSRTNSVALGDVDGDGDLDLVAGNFSQANRVWLNDGSGNFTDSGQALGFNETSSVALGDVDGDGDLDLVAGNYGQSNRVWLNDGAGVFSDSGQALGNNFTYSVALGDVDGDGDLDLVAGNYGQANRVWLNDGSGDFSDSGQALGDHATVSVALGDVDGDGDLDLVEGTFYGQANRVWLNDGSGIFGDSGQTLGNHDTLSVALGDVDGDGDLDFVAGNDAEANRVWLNRAQPIFAVGGNGQVKVYNASDSSERFTLTPFAGFMGSVRVAVADVDGDTIPDIIAAPGKGLAAVVHVFSGKDGSLLPSALDGLVPFAANYSKGLYVAAGDVNGDGRADLFVGKGMGGKVRIFDALTGTLLKTRKPFGSSYVGGITVAAGDVDGDGAAELIVGRRSGTAKVKVFEALEGPAILKKKVFGAQKGVFVAAGDVDNDGHADIIAGMAKGSTNLVKVLDAVGAELANFIALDATFTGGVRVAAVDRDLDGFAEIVVGAGPSAAAPLVRLFDALTQAELDAFFAMDEAFAGGVDVG